MCRDCCLRLKTKWNGRPVRVRSCAECAAHANISVPARRGSTDNSSVASSGSSQPSFAFTRESDDRSSCRDRRGHPSAPCSPTTIDPLSSSMDLMHLLLEAVASDSDSIALDTASDAQSDRSSRQRRVSPAGSPAQPSATTPYLRTPVRVSKTTQASKSDYQRPPRPRVTRSAGAGLQIAIPAASSTAPSSKYTSLPFTSPIDSSYSTWASESAASGQFSPAKLLLSTCVNCRREFHKRISYYDDFCSKDCKVTGLLRCGIGPSEDWLLPAFHC